MDKKVLIFVHINKSAGTTLRGLLKNNFDNDKIYETLSIDIKGSIHEFKNLPEELRNNYDCVLGHMGFGLHECFKSRKFVYITVLREPIRRIVSMYNHTKRTPTMPIWQKGFHADMTLEEFVEERIFFHTNNGQTRYFAATDGYVIDLDDKPELNGEDLSRAKLHLEKYFSLVGLTEKFDESLLLLNEIIDLKNIYYLNRNVSVGSGKSIKLKEIPKNVLKKIEKQNELDLELYEHAQKLFEQKLALFPSINEESVRLFQRENRKKMRSQRIVKNFRAYVRRNVLPRRSG